VEQEAATEAVPEMKFLKSSETQKNRNWVMSDIKGHIVDFSQDQNGSRFIQQRLESSDASEKQLVIDEVLPEVRRLRNDVFGNYVVQKALSVANHAQAVRLVEAMRPHLPGMRNTAGGRRIVAKISRRFPRFDPNNIPNVPSISNVGMDDGPSASRRRTKNNMVNHQHRTFHHQNPHVNYAHHSSMGLNKEINDVNDTNLSDPYLGTANIDSHSYGHGSNFHKHMGN